MAGAVIGLFKSDCNEFTKENAILTATSAEDGGFSFADVPYGNWLVREIEAPTGFVLSDETFTVTVDKDGAVIEVEIENTMIRGTVQLTKVDKDYPDNKLTGAEFSVYRDSNGNKELDADDELFGTLAETGTGVYEMPDLIYGGYFVKENPNRRRASIWTKTLIILKSPRMARPSPWKMRQAKALSMRHR